MTSDWKIWGGEEHLYLINLPSTRAYATGRNGSELSDENRDFRYRARACGRAIPAVQD
jgi:hypothetical protein